VRDQKLNPMEIKDTYPDFLSYWKEAQELPVEGKLEKWRSEYMKKYPSLLSKQLEDYENEDIDWQQVAKERVFPYLEERLPEMTQARSNLREIIFKTPGGEFRIIYELIEAGKAVFIFMVGPRGDI
jgi:mRNA-degrading endonuclease RelE of RelBE toxin-antitoxin system